MTSAAPAPQHPLVGRRVRLRPTAAEDIPFVRAVESAPENAGYVEQWSAAQHHRTLHTPGWTHWIVETRRGGRAAGYVVLQGTDAPDRSLLLRRIAMDAAAKGQGYGWEAVGLVERYCFEVLGFRRLWLTVLEDNRHARALYRQRGFVVENTTQERTRSGHVHTMLIMAKPAPPAPSRTR